MTTMLMIAALGVFEGALIGDCGNREWTQMDAKLDEVRMRNAECGMSAETIKRSQLAFIRVYSPLIFT